MSISQMQPSKYLNNILRWAGVLTCRNRHGVNSAACFHYRINTVLIEQLMQYVYTGELYLQYNLVLFYLYQILINNVCQNPARA